MMLNQTPKTNLTLSAVPSLRHVPDRIAAAVARTATCTICGRALVRTGSRWNHVTQPVESETELRMAWGDR
jgi:hypothetical protein